MKQLIVIGLIFISSTGLIGQQVPESVITSIPGDYTYDLIADRLSCIEQKVPLHFNKQVYSFINYFTVRNRPYTRKVIEKSTVYFPIIEDYLSKYNLPEELKYLAIVESGLYPQAISRAGAGGLWQFMPYTGRTYKLHQDWYIDERFDPFKSTDAACKYLSTLYNMFGNWELALAAYNSGPGNVRKAMRRSGYKKTFWEIYKYLPRETRSYVPQFIAIMYSFHYANEHNLMAEDPEYMMAYDTIMTKGFINLRLLADELDLCYEDIKSLNPAIKRYGLNTSKNYFQVNLPADKMKAFTSSREEIITAVSKDGRKELEYLSRNSVGSTFGRDKVIYRVRSGDVLGTIAQRHHVRISDIKKWNKLHSNLIRVGQRLNIWLYPGTRVVAGRSHPKVELDLAGRKLYIVQPGDTLWDIARMYEGLNIEKIKKLNGLKTSVIKPGQKLIIG